MCTKTMDFICELTSHTWWQTSTLKVQSSISNALNSEIQNSFRLTFYQQGCQSAFLGGCNTNIIMYRIERVSLTTCQV